MRSLILLLAFTVPAKAWEFTPNPVCTIWHTTDKAELVVTYDPARSAPYTITVTLNNATWPKTSPYAIRFDGPRPLTITTDRHAVSEDGSSVIVSDTGFGNVLNGLEANQVATPLLGDQTVAVPLTDAREQVEKFRNCAQRRIS